MPEYLRALVVIVFLAFVGFSIAKKLNPKDFSNAEFLRWRTLWISTSVLAFVSNNFWLYVLGAFAMLLFLAKRSQNKFAVFLLLVTAIPAIGTEVPGFGLVNFLIYLDQPRIVCLAILLPLAFATSRGNTFKLGKTSTDKVFMLYIVLICLLEFREAESFTESLRKCFYICTDCFLPYYVASRSIKNLPQMNGATYALVTSAIIISLIAGFESAKHWILYNPLADALNVKDALGNYLDRAGSVRAIATLGHPITLGFYIMVCFGFYLYFSELVANKLLKKIVFAILMMGAFVPLSRGPWLGTAVVFIFFTMQGPAAFKKLSMLAMAGVLAIPLLSMTPGGQNIVKLIPFLSSNTVEKYNVDYRGDLFTNGMIVVNRNPLFGSEGYMETPEMKAMEQGEHIIDIVNSYLQVMLDSGYVGVTLFIASFLTALFAVYTHTKRVRKINPQLHTLGRALSSVIVGIMLTIGTTGSMGIVSILFWSVIGLSVAYCRITSEHLAELYSQARTSTTSNNKY